jgi:hypothetical protein
MIERMHLKLSRVLVFSLLLLIILLPTTVGFGAWIEGRNGNSHQAPVYFADGEDILPGQYIVVFKDGVSENRIRSASGLSTQSTGIQIHHSFGEVLQGFSATLSDEALEDLRSNPDVAYIEAERIFRVSDSQQNPPWGIDRIDQRDLPLDDVFSYMGTGAGVNVYVLDTGIRISHDEFEGRAQNAFSSINDGHGFEDCFGHGTHVAGIIGGKTYGVAKDVNLFNVRVMDCEGTGTTSQVLEGVEWVTANHIKPAVANMSLGGEASRALDDAIKNSINAGVVYTVAAGNEGVDACNGSPSRIPEAFTVGATSASDQVAWFSNDGDCLDLFAPGVSILSAWNSSDTSSSTESGTSMAAPFVAGVSALFLEGNPQASPAVVAEALLGYATAGRLTGIDNGSPDLLLYSGFLQEPLPTPSPTWEPSETPTASPTAGPSPAPTATPVPQTFQDVPPDHWAYPYIEAIYDAGYISGCSVEPKMYCPDNPLTRAEIAVFLVRGIRGPQFVPSSSVAPVFLDVPPSEWFYKWINVLWEDGYTAGCQIDEALYCPLQYHTRAEGAVFFLRLLHGYDFEPPTPEGLFADTPEQEWYAGWVEAAFNEGLLEPCKLEPESEICPLDLLDRATAAFMMAQAKQLLVP